MLTENTHLGAEAIGAIMDKSRGVFFIGIGGINMSSLAHLTHKAGYYTAGSDRTRSKLCEKLESEGIKVRYEHRAENIEGCDVVVYTVAIPVDNPEYAAAPLDSPLSHDTKKSGLQFLPDTAYGAGFYVCKLLKK